MLQSLNAVSTEIRAKNATFSERYGSGDYAGVAANYSSTAALYPPNSEAVAGRDASETSGPRPQNWGSPKSISNSKRPKGGGDLVAERGTFALKDAVGNLIDRGSYLVVWKQEDGDWKMHWDIWNSDSPAT